MMIIYFGGSAQQKRDIITSMFFCKIHDERFPEYMMIIYYDDSAQMRHYCSYILLQQSPVEHHLLQYCND